jgi:hypothetical protein
MAAGDSHAGVFTWGTVSPLVDQQCEGTAAYTNVYSKRGISCSIAITSASNVLQYTLAADGAALAQGSGTLTNWSEFVFVSDGVALFDANSQLLSETGSLVFGGASTSMFFGRFSLVGAGVFALPQSFSVQYASGAYNFGFLEQ